jgi:hypothetical protein
MSCKNFRLKLDGLNVVASHENRGTLVEKSIGRCDSDLSEMQVHEGVTSSEQAVEGVPILCVHHEFGARARLLEDVQWQLHQQLDVHTHLPFNQ